MSSSPFISILASVILWSALWCAGFGLLSIASGWHALSLHYKHHKDSLLRGRTRRHQTVLMRYYLSYEWSTRVTVNPDGVMLSLFFLFRPFHPTLFIPWSDIAVENKKEFIFNRTVFHFVKAPGLKMRVSRKLGDWMRAAKES